MARPSGWKVGMVAAVIAAAVGAGQGPLVNRAAAPGRAAVPAAAPPAPPAPAASAPATPGLDRAEATLDSLPLRFEANAGQSHPDVRYLARGSGYTLFLTAGEAVLSLRGAREQADEVVRMRLAGAREGAPLQPTGRLPGVTNYLIGADPAGWRTGVKSYAGVRYAGVYPGVDLVYRGTGPDLEYDFEVAPGADPAPIALTIDGGARPRIDAGGDLVVGTSAGELRQHKPVLYQLGDGGRRRPIAGRFELRPGGAVGFQVGAYDRSRPLVIDPVVRYSTFMGGSAGGAIGGNGTVATGVAADASGNAYVTGITRSTNYPTQGPFQGANGGHSDRFVTKVNTGASGAASLVYSTYLGGSRSEGETSASVGGLDGGGIAVDGSGSAYVTGGTRSANFPVTTTPVPHDGVCGTGSSCNATNNTYADGVTTNNSTTYTSVLAGFGPDDVGLGITGTNIPAGTTIVGLGTNNTTVVLSQAATANGSGLTFTVANRDPVPDAFLAKLTPAGSGLAYATYLGGADFDGATDIALGSGANAYLAGITKSAAFPTAGSPYDATCGTAAGCNATDDAFTGGGASTVSSTAYFSDDAEFTSADVGRAISGTNIPAGATIAAVVSRRQVTLSAAATGTGPNLPFTIAGRIAQADAIAARIDTASSGPGSLTWSTYFGGSGVDTGRGIAADGSGRAYVAGDTASTDLPTAGAAQVTPGGVGDLFLARLDPGAGGAGSLLYATYLGGAAGELAPLRGGGVAVDASANAFVTGQTSSTDFPTAGSPFDPTANGSTDAFVAKLNTAGSGPSSLVYSTYLGGSGLDVGADVALDGASPAGVTVVGDTDSPGFPLVRKLQNHGGQTDAFVAKLSGTGSALTYSTFLGAASTDSATAVAVAADAVTTTYVVGSTASSGYPVTSGAFQPNLAGTLNGFLTRLDPTVDAPVLDGASPRGGPTTGGTPVTLTGEGFSGATTVAFGATTVFTNPCPAVPPAGGCFTVNSSTQITAVTPVCTGCSTANVNVASAQGSSSPTVFTFGEGLFSTPGAGTCTACSGGASVVRLATGKVLAVNRSSGAAEVYDPAAGTWSATASCPGGCGKTGSTLTLLPNGKVLLAGGGDVLPTAAAFLYDPGPGAWTATASMPAARSFHSATLLNTGRVLVAGGCPESCLSAFIGAMNTTALFDPAGNGGAGTWSAGDTMAGARFAHTATLLDGPACRGASPPTYCGRVMVSGGSHLSGVVATAERYDPVGNAWASAGSMGTDRMFFAATLLDDGACAGTPASPPAYCGKVLISGGLTAWQSQPRTNTAELYDPAANGAARWTATGAMAHTRKDHTSTRLPNGKVLVAGSLSDVGGSLGELYNPTAATFSSAGGLGGPPAIGANGILLSGPTSMCATRCGRVLFASSSATIAPGLYTPRPVVTAITPTTGAGAGVTSVTLTGTGLASLTQARFGTEAGGLVTPDATNPDTTAVALSTGSLNAAGGTVDLTAVSPGGASDTTGTADNFTFASHGALRVTTSPSLPSQVEVDGVPRSTYGLINLKLPTGAHQVCFRDVEGFITPACQNVTVTAGNTTVVNGAFVAKGFLQVVTNPALPATIRVDGVPRDDWGIFTDLAVGAHQVCFGPVLDFAAPACQNITLTAGQVTTVTGNYTLSLGAPGEPAGDGFLRVTSSPSLPTQVSVDGIERGTYGLTNLRLAPGAHQVCYRDVEGFVTPACQNVTITAGNTTVVTGTFVAKGFLQAVTNPAVPGTVYVDGVGMDDWGIFTDIPVGSHQVCFGVMTSTVVPACQTVTVNAGATTTVTGNYILI